MRIRFFSSLSLSLNIDHAKKTEWHHFIACKSRYPPLWVRPPCQKGELDTVFITHYASSSVTTRWTSPLKVQSSILFEDIHRHTKILVAPFLKSRRAASLSAWLRPPWRATARRPWATKASATSSHLVCIHTQIQVLKMSPKV